VTYWVGEAQVDKEYKDFRKAPKVVADHRNAGVECGAPCAAAQAEYLRGNVSRIAAHVRFAASSHAGIAD
jgi:hypothetical protein